APSGTRKKMPNWKSGFYHIALQADVSVVCGYLDFQKKEAHLGFSFMPTGNIKQDMDKVRDYYRDVNGKYPDKTTPVKLDDESL
ncbi:MAG: acyltransferase, partial [Gammaproteobacteria bacterium]|nr:acyltransferase [Gammaproteobacteria bacterium]